MKIAAVSTGTQRLRAAEAHLFQIPEGVVVTFAEEPADLRAAARRTGVVPQAFADREVEAVTFRRECAVPCVAGSSFPASSPRRFSTV